MAVSKMQVLTYLLFSVTARIVSHKASEVVNLYIFSFTECDCAGIELPRVKRRDLSFSSLVSIAREFLRVSHPYRYFAHFYLHTMWTHSLLSSDNLLNGLQVNSHQFHQPSSDNSFMVSRDVQFYCVFFKPSLIQA